MLLYLYKRKGRKEMKKNIWIRLTAVLCFVPMLCSCSQLDEIATNIANEKTTNSTSQSYQIVQSDSEAYGILNGNKPEFDTVTYSEAFEEYGELDDLGRCTQCFANIGLELMPDEERGAIGSVKPTGWQSAKYDCVDGKYLYNRCHLIGYQLTAENANEKNLITGTRFLNVEGMLPFENAVADYVRDTSNHVLYRVTPDFQGSELVARGVQIEAYSVEDNGEGICFNVYCYNIQPDIEIDYLTGESKYIGNEEQETVSGEKQNYVVNISTKKFHKEDCDSLKNIKEQNKKAYYGYRDNLISNGYSPCGQCNP